MWRREANLTKDDKGRLLLVGVAAILLGILGWKMIETKPPPDREGCTGPIERSIVVLLDHSEETTEQTHQEIISRVLKHVTESPPNTLVAVYSITKASKAQLKPSFSRCRPQDSGNRFVENPTTIKRQFEQSFLAPLREVISKKIEVSEESPLAQAITDISLTRHLRAPTNTLLVFSDLLENTNKFSLYKCTQGTTAVEDFRRTRQGAKERPEFTNTTVELHVIPRYDLAPTALNCRGRFWNWFFGDNKGPHATVSIDLLPGGDPR